MDHVVLYGHIKFVSVQHIAQFMQQRVSHITIYSLFECITQFFLFLMNNQFFIFAVIIKNWCFSFHFFALINYYLYDRSKHFCPTYSSVKIVHDTREPIIHFDEVPNFFSICLLTNYFVPIFFFFQMIRNYKIIRLKSWNREIDEPHELN